MGDLTLATMRDALTYDLFQRTDLTTSQKDRWINWSYRHVSMPRVFRHRELQIDTQNLITLVTGQVSYDISAATLGMEVPYVYDVTYVDGPNAADLTRRRRKLYGGQDIREFENSYLAQGEPTHYALYGPNTLYINMRPTVTQNGNVVRLRGWRVPMALTDPAHTTVLLATFDEVILLGARWRGFRSLGRTEMAELAKGDFVGLLNDMQVPWTSDAEDWGGYFQPDLLPYERGDVR